MPVKQSYLASSHRSRTRKVINRSGSLLGILLLCALGVWVFTPVSEVSDYKLDEAIKANQFSAKNTPQRLTPEHPRTPAVRNQIKPAAYAYETLAKLETLPAEASVSRQHASSPDTNSSPVQIVRFKTPSILASGYKAETDDTQVDASPAQDVVKAVTPRPTDSIQDGRIERFTIESGDTLTRIFSRAKLPISQAIKLSQNADAARLNRLSIGKTMRIYFDANDQWETLEYDTDKLNTLIVSPEISGFKVTQYEKQVEYRTSTARGVIHSTLGLAAENAGVPAGITQKLVDIYQWEIDFARDIKVGDAFSVVYQKAYIDDKVVADGAILAASFTSSGKTIDAIRYTDSTGITGYFQPDGTSLRRGFLRTPIKLARITSTFGKRFHPIKKIWKKHLGVDYGARRGTPILATADGAVQYAGKKGGYGNTVILRHGGIYSTLYAHMSKLGKGIRSGKTVTQGQIIGYVGHTGWATGDHLHYEFRVNGQHKDPLKVKLPKTLPLAKKEMDTFTDHAGPLLGTLTSLRAAQLATVDAPQSESTL